MQFFLLWGLLLGLVATIAARLVGEVVLDPDRLLITLLTFVIAVPLAVAITYPVYRWRRVSLPDRPLAAVLTALPGMLLGVIGIAFFSFVYSNFNDGAETLFAAWVLWLYSLILVSGFIAEPQARRV